MYKLPPAAWERFEPLASLDAFPERGAIGPICVLQNDIRSGGPSKQLRRTKCIVLEKEVVDRMSSMPRPSLKNRIDPF